MPDTRQGLVLPLTPSQNPPGSHKLLHKTLLRATGLKKANPIKNQIRYHLILPALLDTRALQKRSHLPINSDLGFQPREEELDRPIPARKGAVCGSKGVGSRSEVEVEGAGKRTEE